MAQLCVLRLKTKLCYGVKDKSVFCGGKHTTGTNLYSVLCKHSHWHKRLCFGGDVVLDKSMFRSDVNVAMNVSVFWNVGGGRRKL